MTSYFLQMLILLLIASINLQYIHRPENAFYIGLSLGIALMISLQKVLRK